MNSASASTSTLTSAFLVTGGAGFIGSHIVEELLKRGHRVRVIDNFSTGRRENIDAILKNLDLKPVNPKPISTLTSTSTCPPPVSGPLSSVFFSSSTSTRSPTVFGPRSSVQLFTFTSSSTCSLELIVGDIRDLELLRWAMTAPFGAGQEIPTSPIGHSDRSFVIPSERKRVEESLSPTCLSHSEPAESLPRGNRGESLSSSQSPAIDFVLHQAALPSVQRSIEDPLTTMEVNVNGTLNVLIAARDAKVKRVVYASSSSVYGDTEELPKYEEMKPNPLSPYAVSKLTGEYLCRVFSKVYGLETVALRYFNVFGPRQDPNSEYAAVIPKFIKAFLNNERPVIFGDGEQSRDFTPVENVVLANLAACIVPMARQVEAKVKVKSSSSTSSSTSTFLLANVGTGERHTLNELVRELCRLTGKNIEPVYASPRPGDVRHSAASIQILCERLGVTHIVKLSEGLERLIKWYKLGQQKDT